MNYPGEVDMERNEVKAFRQRLVRGGFTDICIYDTFRGQYSVQCVTPQGDRICVYLTVEQMKNIPRKVYF